MKRRDTVVLDLDGTLVDEKRNVDDAFAAVGQLVQRETGIDASLFASVARVTAQRLWWKPAWLDSLSDEFGLSSWDALSADYVGAVAALDRLRAWLPAYRRATWTLALARCGVPEMWAATASEVFVEHRRDYVYPLPGAVDLVEALAEDRTLVVLTNGSAEDQRRKLVKAGLSSMVRDIVVSTELGAAKPHPVAIESALDRAGGNAERAIMIGDTYDRDVCGALVCGVPAIWITWGKIHTRPRHDLVTPVSSTAEVLPALHELEDTLSISARPHGRFTKVVRSSVTSRDRLELGTVEER